MSVSKPDCTYVLTVTTVAPENKEFEESLSGLLDELRRVAIDVKSVTVSAIKDGVVLIEETFGACDCSNLR